MKRTTSRAREFVPCWSAHHGPARTRAKSQTPGRLKHIEEFPDSVLTLALIRRSDGRAGTRLEMVFQQQRIDLLQRTLDGHGLFDDIDAVCPILDHPCHAPHVSLDTAQADGGLGPDARAAMLEVDFGHRHEAPPPSFPPPLWGGVRSTYHHPWGFAMLSYRETPITCTSRAATVPSPLACPTITTRSLACSAAQDARKPWNRVVALMMMMRVPPVSRTTIRFGPRATTTPRQMMSLLKTGEAARSLTSIARASSRPSSRRNPSTVTRSPRWIPQIAERANQSPSSPSTRVPRCTHTTHTRRSSNPKRRARSDLKTRKRN